jgi:hypothetical protein
MGPARRRPRLVRRQPAGLVHRSAWTRRQPGDGPLLPSALFDLNIPDAPVSGDGHRGRGRRPPTKRRTGKPRRRLPKRQGSLLRPRASRPPRHPQVLAPRGPRFGLRPCRSEFWLAGRAALFRSPTGRAGCGWGRRSRLLPGLRRSVSDASVGGVGLEWIMNDQRRVPASVADETALLR